mgnify:CR=1 FL=1
MQRAVALDPASRPLRNDLGLAYATLGQIFQRTLRLRDAADLYRRALDIREGLVNENPDNTTYRHNLLVNYGNLGDVLASQPWQNLGDTSGAIAVLEKAAALAELSRRTDPADRGASFDFVNAKCRLGLAMTEDPARLDAALANYAEAARLTKELRAQDPKRYAYAQFDGLLEWRSGQTLLLLGRSDAAAKRFEAAQTIAAGWLGTSGATLRPLYVRSTAALATVRAQAGDVQCGRACSRCGARARAAAAGTDQRRCARLSVGGSRLSRDCQAHAGEPAGDARGSGPSSREERGAAANRSRRPPKSSRGGNGSCATSKPSSPLVSG